MIITRKWLEKYLDLSKITNFQISVCLNSLGFEVEEQIDYAKFNSKIILGYIESVEEISGTKLKKTKTKIGKNKYATILSTSRNIISGKYVIVALPGAKLFNGVELDNRKMQGIVSEGMFCGFNEIAFSNHVLTEAEQVEIHFVNSLNHDLSALLGQDITKIIGLDDQIFDVDLTLNRSDALGAMQLVKEIANYFDLRINKPKNKVKFAKQTRQYNINVDAKLQEQVNTISYSLIGLNQNQAEFDSHDDVWLKLCKVKSAENKFENIANLATLTTGQPFILIDADKLHTNELLITTTLINDKTILTLQNNNAVISTIGLKTESDYKVSDMTTSMLVVMLNIDQIIMRQQLKHLNTSNIDLQRYAKPLNPNLYNQGLDELLINLQRYNLLKTVEPAQIICQKKSSANIYKTTLTKVIQVLGMEFTSSQIISLFKTLDIEVKAKKDELTFVIDQNRTDIYGQFDLCEEIARLYGYDNLEEKPLEYVVFNKPKNLQRKLKTKLTDYLIGAGFNNIKTYSLTEKESNQAWNLFNVKHMINLMSPLSKQRESYRTNLAKSMLETIIFNANNDNKNVKLFEMGDIFALNDYRQNNLCFGISGDVMVDPLMHVNIQANYLYIQSVLKAILTLYQVDLNHISYKKSSKINDSIHPFVNAEIKYKNQLLGFIFKLNPSFEKQNKIAPTYFCEINLDVLLSIANKTHVTKEISKFQKSTRAISIELDNQKSYSDLIQKIIKGANYLTSYMVVDQYTNQTMQAKNLYSLTIKFEFNSFDKQLVDQQITDEFNKILANVNELGLIVR